MINQKYEKKIILACLRVKMDKQRLKIKQFYQRKLERKLENEPFIYVDDVKIFQELPDKWKMLVNKIKILKIQKSVLKKQFRSTKKYLQQQQIIEDYQFLKLKLEELEEKLEEETDGFF